MKQYRSNIYYYIHGARTYINTYTCYTFNYMRSDSACINVGTYLITRVPISIYLANTCLYIILVCMRVCVLTLYLCRLYCKRRETTFL